MPSVLPLFKGWRVVIFTNDHRPPHVHVLGPQEHARFELLCDLGQVRLMSNLGFSLKQLQQIADHLLKHISRLCAMWGRIHGS
jgi:Domain of unknown function (DUF4160)